jgi:hypothetical protein
MQASRTFGLPCPWAPLQSVTTAASRRIHAVVRHHRATEVDRGYKANGEHPTTSPMGFVSSRRMSPGNRCVGLPPRRHSLSEFLTLSAILARPNLVALFHATSAHRISASRALPPQPAVASSDARCSRAISVGKPTYDFRALLRLRIRTRATAVKRTREPMLS